MKTNVMENMMIGFDQLISQLHRPYTSYPPYNVVKTETGYMLELAVAGFDKSELEVEVDGGELVIKGTKTTTTPQQYLYQGLAHRNWCRRFVLDPQLEIASVTLVSGVLTVHIHTQQIKTTTKLEIH